MTFYELPEQWQPYVTAQNPPPSYGILPEKWKSHLTLHLPHPSHLRHPGNKNNDTNTKNEASSAKSQQTAVPDAAASASNTSLPPTPPQQRKTQATKPAKPPHPPTYHPSYLPFDTPPIQAWEKVTNYFSHPHPPHLPHPHFPHTTHHQSTLATSHPQIYHHNHPWNEGTTTYPNAPDTDVHEADTYYLLELDVPGVKDKKDIGIRWTDEHILSVSGNVTRLPPHMPLTPGAEDDDDNELVRVDSHSEDDREKNLGDKKATAGKAVKQDKARLLIVERRVGNWERHFTFPLEMEREGLLAELGDGVLRIWMRKVPVVEKSDEKKEDADVDVNGNLGVHEGVTWIN